MATIIFIIVITLVAVFSTKVDSSYVIKRILYRNENEDKKEEQYRPVKKPKKVVLDMNKEEEEKKNEGVVSFLASFEENKDSYYNESAKDVIDEISSKVS